MPITTDVSDEKRLQITSEQGLKQARDFAIINEESYRIAGERLIAAKEFIKGAKKHLDPVVEKSRIAWQANIDLRKKIIDPATATKEIYSKKMGDFQEEQEEKRRLAEIEAQAKLEKEAEDAKVKEAAELEKNGKKDEAEHVLNQTTVVAPVVESKIPKVANTQTRTHWYFKVKNKDAIPRSHMMEDTTKIQKDVNTHHKEAEKLIPGIEVWSEKKVV